MNRKGLGIEFDVGAMGVAGVIGFAFAIGVPLALAAYVFYAQIITMECMSEVKGELSKHGHEEPPCECTQIYASNIIVLVLMGTILLAGVYAIGAFLIGVTSGGGVYVRMP